MYSFRMMFVIGCSLLTACSKESSLEDEPSGKITLEFVHSVNELPLNYTDEYTTDLGETYNVSRFRYYIHNVEMTTSTGTTVNALPGYFLVDEDLPASKRFSFKVPANEYVSVNFTLGVDSTDNMSGAQAGALDPANGMFWTWNSGYVMAKLEGSSPFVTGASQNFSYHIGGYKSPYAVIKKIVLPVGSLSFIKDTSLTVQVNADINTWFSRVNPILMSATPACHSPGELAKKIADNYEGMFTLQAIE